MYNIVQDTLISVLTMTHQVNDELYLAAFSWSRSQALNGNVPTLHIKQEMLGQCIA